MLLPKLDIATLKSGIIMKTQTLLPKADVITLKIRHYYNKPGHYFEKQ